MLKRLFKPASADLRVQFDPSGTPPLALANSHGAATCVGSPSLPAASSSLSSALRSGSAHSSQPNGTLPRQFPVSPFPSIPSGNERLHHASQNPFHYDFTLDWYEKTKMVAMCLLGVPLIRLVLMLVLIVIAGTLATFAMINWNPIDPVTNSPRRLQLWRRVLLFPVRVLTRVLLFVLGFYWISVKHPVSRGETMKNLPRLVISNHIAFIDGIFFTYYLYPSIAMKAEMEDIPLIGNILRSFQPIKVDRNSEKGRHQAYGDIRSHLENDHLPPLLIFPEGTTSNQNFLTRFKVGAFTAGMPCQPIVLRYPFKHFDLSWPPTVSAGYLMGRLLCQVSCNMEVEVLPVYTPTEADLRDPKVYADHVRQVMADTLQIPCTNHAFEDVALLLRVGEYASHHVMTITDVHEISSLTCLRDHDLQQLVEYFKKHDTNQDGLISLEDLTRMFPQEQPELLAHFFQLLDADGNGFIDFREMCFGLTTLRPETTREQMIKFAFNLYDVKGQGSIDPQELRHVLRVTSSLYGFTPRESPSSTPGTTPTSTPTNQETGDHPDPIKRTSFAPFAGSEIALNADGRIDFENFKTFMLARPELLGNAREKLEKLGGFVSVQVSPRPYAQDTLRAATPTML